MKTHDELPGTILVGKLEVMTGLGAERLRHLARRGFFPTPKKDAYPFAESLTGCFRYFREELVRLAAPESWTLNGLSHRTGIDRRTWVNILRDTKPMMEDGEGRYTLRSVIDAVRAASTEDAGSLEREKARLTAAQADLAEMDRATRRKELVEVEAVFATWQNVCLSVRRVVLVSGLPERDQDAILAELEKATLNAIEEQAEFKKATE